MDTQKLTVILVPFIVYCILGLYYGEKVSNDDAEYLVLSEGLLRGELPQVKTHRIVHFSALALMEWLFDYNIPLIRLYLILVSTGSVYLMYCILKTRYDSEDSVWGALLLSSGPALVYVSPTMLIGPVGLFYSLLGLYLYLSSKDDFFILSASGLVLGLGFLARETVLAMFAAIVFAMLARRDFKRAMVFSFSFALLPALYGMLIPSELLRKWIFFLFDTAAVTPGKDYMRVFFRVIHFLLGLQLLGIIGAYATAKGFLKSYRNKLGDLDIILLVYFIISLVLIVTWPLTNIRYFMALLPTFAYYTVGYLPKMLDRYRKHLMAIIILTGYIGGYAVGYFFLGLEQPTEDAVYWISSNIGRSSIIYTNSDAMSYHLRHRDFTVVDDIGQADFIVEIYVPVKAGFESRVPGTEDMTSVRTFEYVRPALIQRMTYGGGQTVRILKAGFSI